MSHIKKYILPYLWIAIASVIHTIGFNWCYVPNQIGFGGITGVGQILNVFIPVLPVGMAILLLNLPLFLLGWRLLGGQMLVSSLFATVLTSVTIDMLSAVYTFQPMDPLLGCIFGGMLVGASLGMILLQGATTGGTDLIARLLKLKFAWLPMGKLLMAVDLAVIVATAIVFRRFESALYGLVALYISSIVMDMVLYGMDHAKVAYIISDHHEAITQAIVHDMDRGVTILHGEGAYTGTEKQVLLVAFKQRQIVSLKRMVQALDPNAFLIVCEAHEVLGGGFRSYQQNEI
ncbi:MAG: YitT family protein [Oscillospiraceae bacterium]|nr:YitT family protein [Oscillospiraceae bacterium]